MKIVAEGRFSLGRPVELVLVDSPRGTTAGADDISAATVVLSNALAVRVNLENERAQWDSIQNQTCSLAPLAARD